MPDVLIETRKHRPPVAEARIMDAVHTALVECFQAKAENRNVRLIVHEPHRFACPPSCQQPAMYTFITIHCFAGRSMDAKRRLYATIVERLVALDIPDDHIKIMLCEGPPENWGIHGGQAACDVDLDYNVKV